MTTDLNRRWLIAARPIGRALRSEDFAPDLAAIPTPEDGELLVRSLYLEMAPAQKSWMENITGYARPTEIGGVMPGTGLGRVIQSRSPHHAAGDLVRGPLGWQEFAVVEASQVDPVPADIAPTLALGVLGSSGRTAYFGLLHVGRPRPGDVIVVSGAAGAVGSVVAQLGRVAGCRVIGIAGGAEKCAQLAADPSFEAVIDYKIERVRSRLRELSPGGVDIFFDNVGGDVLNEVLSRLAYGARVVICGGISRYNADPRDPSQMPPGPRNYFNLVATQATMQGFLVHQFAAHYPVADARLAAWVRSGDLRQREDIVDGFENAPRALLRLFEGKNLGKQIVRLDAARA